MHALVTGGGGFLGRWIVEKLLARDDRVRILSRGDYPELANQGVDCRRGDIRDAAAVSSACRGVDVVFHAAALAAMWGKKEEIFDINLGGTEQVIAACREHGVPRLVYTSSPSVVFGRDPHAGTDESVHYPQSYLAHYPHSKAAAERRVLAANGKGDLFTCSLRPHLIWGPRDNHIIPMLASRARQKRLIQVGAGDNLVSLTYVENAADAHLLAANRLAPGSRVAGRAYFITDAEPVNMWEWIRDLLQRLELPGVSRTISATSAYRLGAVLEGLYTVFPFLGEPRLTRFLALQFACHHYFDIGNARRDLGYDPAVTNEDGLERTVAWYREEMSG